MRYCACKKSSSVVGTNPGNFLNKIVKLSTNVLSYGYFPLIVPFLRTVTHSFCVRNKTHFMPDSVKEIHRIHKSAQM